MFQNCFLTRIFPWQLLAVLLVIAEEMALPQRRPFVPETICMEWQQRQRAGAGLYNLGNTCFINSVLQCLTYTPPLANYLLSREHSQSCRRQGFCVMCSMEEHVHTVLHSSGTAIEPWAIIRVLRRIGEHFEADMQEDAHEFLRCTVDAMQRDCLSNLDFASQSDTVVHQIFGGFLRSRVTCLSCSAVSDSYEAFLDVPLDIEAASSVPAALQDFVKPEKLGGENCFKCSRCDKMVTASKRFTVHRAPKVLTVCLKRFEFFTSSKISKVVEYPEHLDLHPYMSETAGEPLLYSLYAVLVHGGDSCDTGHYYCYVKASDGLWYEMEDDFVGGCDIDTVLSQQAYLLFYVRNSSKTMTEPKRRRLDLELGERASSSWAVSYARSFLSQWAAGSMQAASVGPQGLPRQTQEESCCQPFDRVPHTVREDNSKEEHGSSPSSHCQRNGARERAQSRSPRRGYDLRRRFVEYGDCHHSGVHVTGTEMGCMSQQQGGLKRSERPGPEGAAQWHQV
ncbi:ubiquitin carboxyl-terminal hydrolase 17-like protein 6 [Strix uralensis]|uniref:ubiquitin carboxyl-terminal hydrolase 17-like protein 6 n=1 Tax=Strix uralensis TaxID=36305 RepID=UPI003DA76A97